MHTLQFWKSWAKVYQRVGLLIAGAFVFAFIYMWYAWFLAPAPALQWVNIQEQELVQIPIHSFQQGLLELTVFGDTYLIFEKLLGDSIKPNPQANYIFITILILSGVVLLTIITTLTRFWYLIGMGLFILFVVGFRMEIIQMFGVGNKIFTIVILTLYIIPSFYFQFFKSHISFLTRLITFAGITIVVGLCITSFAGVSHPMLHLSVTGITAGIILSVIFILMVAHEILAAFVYVASQSTKQSKSLNHFLIISVIYMINLALAYAHKIGSLDWNFIYINFFLLLSISALLGIWGFRHREPQYENILSADPFGVFFFLSLGSICFATISFFIGTANDAALVTINDTIIYSHLGYGIIFLTYVLSNFIAMLAKNLPVYKVLYKPNNMPYFTFRFGGLIATLAFFFYNTWQVPVQNAFSAYHNATGDLYLNLGNIRFAEAFYQRAGVYGFLNHHSNYAIATIEGSSFNSLKERNFYNRANQLRPTAFSLLNYSHTYEREGNWLEAMLALKEAKRNFPESGPIENTLALLYAKLNAPDSALSTFQNAMEHAVVRDAAQTNFVGVAAKSNINVSADSLLRLLKSDNPGTKSNALAFANLQGTTIDMELSLPSDSTLDLFSASLINNYLLNHLGRLDDTFINHVVNIAKLPVNSDYREAVLYSAALACYADGQIGKAFSLLQEVTIMSSDQNKYNTILTLWALEQDALMDAQRFARYLLNQSIHSSDPVLAVVLSESGRLGEAVVEWDSIKKSNDTTFHKVAQQMINALAGKENLLEQFSDDEQFLFAVYRIPLVEQDRFKRTLSLINDNDLKARVILKRSKQLFEYDEMEEAIALLQLTQGLELTDRSLYEQLQHYELDLLAAQNDLVTLSDQINNSDIRFSNRYKNQKIYFEARISEANGDSTIAREKYNVLAKANPYDEEAVINAARFLKRYSTDQYTAYNILTDALHANPFSVKLLKAYSLEATQLNFNEYASSAIDRLRPLISPQALKEFLLQHKKEFAQLL